MKPSERIDELAREAALAHLGEYSSLGERLSYARCTSTRVEAIVRYLNEVHEMQKTKEDSEEKKDAQYNCPPRDVLELQRQLAVAREQTAFYKKLLQRLVEQLWGASRPKEDE